MRARKDGLVIDCRGYHPHGADIARALRGGRVRWALLFLAPTFSITPALIPRALHPRVRFTFVPRGDGV